MAPSPSCAPFATAPVLLSCMLLAASTLQGSSQPVYHAFQQSEAHKTASKSSGSAGSNASYLTYLEDGLEHSAWVGSRKDWVRTFGAYTWTRCLVHLWLRCVADDGSQPGSAAGGRTLHLRGFLHLEPLDTHAARQPPQFALRQPIRGALAARRLARSLKLSIAASGGVEPTFFNVVADAEGAIHIDAAVHRSGKPFDADDVFHVQLEGWPQAHELNAGRCEQRALTAARAGAAGAAVGAGAASKRFFDAPTSFAAAEAARSGRTVQQSSATAALPAEPRLAIVLTPVINKPFGVAARKATRVPLAVTAEILRVHAGKLSLAVVSVDFVRNASVFCLLLHRFLLSQILLCSIPLLWPLAGHVEDGQLQQRPGALMAHETFLSRRRQPHWFPAQSTICAWESISTMFT